MEQTARYPNAPTSTPKGRAVWSRVVLYYAGLFVLYPATFFVMKFLRDVGEENLGIGVFVVWVFLFAPAVIAGPVIIYCKTRRPDRCSREVLTPDQKNLRTLINISFLGVIAYVFIMLESAISIGIIRNSEAIFMPVVAATVTGFITCIVLYAKCGLINLAKTKTASFWDDHQTIRGASNESIYNSFADDGVTLPNHVYFNDWDTRSPIYGSSDD